MRDSILKRLRDAIFGTGTIPDMALSVSDAVSGAGRKVVRAKGKVTPKQKAYNWTNISRPGWEKPLYDLVEVEQAIGSEAYAARSIDKHREHVLRHGWSLTGRNQKAREYILKRFRELSEAMGRPIEGEIRQAICNFISLSNFFLVWTRSRTEFYTSRFGKRRGKLTGLFSMNPVSVRFRRDKRNRILEWYQVIDGHTDEELKPHNVIHGAFDRRDGFILGRPYILPVLDDILTWRRFEEITEILAHKFAFPLYHHKIGDKDIPPEDYDDGTSEIAEAQAAVGGMPPEGHLFTSYRHNIEVIGAKAQAIDMHPYLEYWESRVLSGLNLSPIDLGRGDTANRATADTISKGLADRCSEFQQVFAEYFNFYVLDELLLEGGFDLTPENRVTIFFPPIDREAKRAEDTHLVFLYQAQAITHSEMREEMGRKVFDESDWKDTNWEQVVKPTALIKAVDEFSGLGSNPSTTNKAKPTNQYGTKPTVTKVKKDSLSAQMKKVIEIHDGTTDDLTQALLSGCGVVIRERMEEAVAAYNKDNSCSTYLGSTLLRGFMEDCALPIVERVVAQKDKNLQMLDASLFDLLDGAAWNYAYARMCQIHGKHTHVVWGLTDSACDLCRKQDMMKIRRFTLGQLIPRHQKCVTHLVPVKKP